MTLGNSEVGKTCYILKYTENVFQELYLTTVGIDFKIKTETINNKQYKLFLYDTTGQEKYKSIALNIIRNAQGIILMYDITNKKSFESIPEWIKSIRDSKGENFPMILLGNKLDKEDIRVISEKEGKELAERVGAENVYDFSLGNPSVPAPEAVKETAVRTLETQDPLYVHGYMLNSGFEDVRTAVADDLNVVGGDVDHAARDARLSGIARRVGHAGLSLAEGGRVVDVVGQYAHIAAGGAHDDLFGVVIEVLALGVDDG